MQDFIALREVKIGSTPEGMLELTLENIVFEPKERVNYQGLIYLMLDQMVSKFKNHTELQALRISPKLLQSAELQHYQSILKKFISSREVHSKSQTEYLYQKETPPKTTSEMSKLIRESNRVEFDPDLIQAYESSKHEINPLRTAQENFQKLKNTFKAESQKLSIR